jgi:hypothetical protein
MLANTPSEESKNQALHVADPVYWTDEGKYGRTNKYVT